MNKGKVLLYAMIAIPIAFMIIPTVIVLCFWLLPSFVAFLMERRKGWYGGACVGALNLAGASPYLTDLWFHNHTVEGAFDILSNIWALLVVYGCAAIGWAVYITTPSIVSAFMAMTADRRITVLKDQQKELVLKWGPDVESVYEPEDKGDKPMPA